MALTESQKASIRMYLGWSERFHQTDSRLEQAFGALSVRAEAEALIVTELGYIASLETKIQGMTNRFKALKVGSIELDGAKELALLRSMARQSCGRMAALMGVEVRHGAFSGSGPKGYASGSGVFPADSSSNMFRHG